MAGRRLMHGSQMMLKNSTRLRQFRVLARRVGAVAMLSLYALGSVQTGYLHRLFHPEELAAAHSPHVEKDPCHRAVQHGIDAGCRHKVHLVKVHSCGLCHTLVASDLLLLELPAVVPPQSIRENVAPFHDGATIKVTHTFNTRGPPAELHA